MSDAIGPGEAARRLGVSTRTVQRWLREGRLPAIRVGGRLKVDPAALAPASGGDHQPAKPAHTAIGRLLVANRGELVVRIARTCRQLGIQCIGLVAEDQVGSWWTRAVDELAALGSSYLDADAVIAAALAARADAVHPGYGFLAENADFADAVVEAGLLWVGPTATAMRALGDKAAARQVARAAGVPVLEGYDGDDQSDTVLLREARRIGMPVLIKPSAGGGGKGMHVVRTEAELVDRLAVARREARTAFGDERLILERHLETPRHIEVQLLSDAHGHALHLGERECSLQRRHQKVIEEGPSPAVTPALRRRLGEAAVALARSAGYRGAGTAEFLLAPDGSFYFLELNARLQVEHPVTEMVTGHDLVAEQLRIGAGEPLSFSQEDVAMNGHAVEARLYAEDPDNDFLPAAGEVVDVRWPANEGVRIDAGVGAGDVVGTRYDPLLAKLIAHGKDRAEALKRLDDALAATSVMGVTTNRGFLRWLVGLPEVREGKMHTQLIDELWHPGGDDLLPAAWQQAALALSQAGEASSSVTRGFRLNQPARLRVQIGADERSVDVPAESTADAHTLTSGGSDVILDFEGRSIRAGLAPPPTVEAAVRHAAHPGDGAEVVSAPMPGSVLQVRVSEDDQVEAGQVLLVLEAMKMENSVTAPAPGHVARILVEVGQQVQRGDPLVEVT